MRDLDEYIMESVMNGVEELMSDNDRITIDDLAWKSLDLVDSIKCEIRDKMEDILIKKGVEIIE